MSNLPLLLPFPSEWVLDASSRPPVYTRPMGGSELIMQSFSNDSDGAGECCIGINFTSSIRKEEMKGRARQAVDKLRFVCPLIACTIGGDVETPRWIYTLSADREAWLDLAFAVVERGTSLNPSEFVTHTNLRRLPYVDGKGTTTHLRVYLLTTSAQRDDRRMEYGLYFHASHCILDAGPALHGLNLLCEWMSGKGMAVTVTPSEEWKNLPVDTIAATGGPCKEWDSSGRQLLQFIKTQKERSTPRITLPMPSRPLDMSDPPFTRSITLSEAETAAIVAQTRKLGVTMTALFYAANTLAQFKMNPIPSEVDFFQDDTAIALERYLKPPVNPKTHLVSHITYIPLRFSMTQPFMERSEKKRLIRTAKMVQAQLDHYLTNPCLPQLAAVAAAMPLSKEDVARRTHNAWRCRVVNMGSLENKVKRDHGEIVVESLNTGNRREKTVTIHVWTMHAKCHFQVQGAAAWGEACLNTVLEETVRTVMLVLPVEKRLASL